MPAFVNLQQYYVEQYLVDRAMALNIDLRWKNKVVAVDRKADHAVLTLETPDGSYQLEADWVIACDGARSPLRGMLGLEFEGELFEERFLIADIEMEADFPSERWFWFEPGFHNGQSALLHKQPDNIYRIDLQLGWDTDPEVEKLPERIIPRIEKVVGHKNFTLDWTSIYTFQCRRLRSFVHGPVLFVGDSAHVVSPFGARGGNGRGHSERDAAAWAGLQRPTHRDAGVLHHMQGGIWVVGMEVDARAVDAVEEVKTDVGLARHVQRLVDEGAGLIALALVQGHFGQALQRQRLTHWPADGVVQPGAFTQVFACSAQVAGQPLGLTAQSDAERMATQSAQALRLS
jgi:hypothetical protein